ncbi:uncharacterized protein LOC105939542 isoform X2 [Fundulus heteroclitus]|uniref:uncharacterized protein LOC105939542 isoform X2 n=1 Tax=Fundulus heteroclitus TaxID=8078 RepID=UPI00165AB8CE|nr:uncharacterized protein LOC105939542 isoform X2 [Fundulus heteroclitus]
MSEITKSRRLAWITAVRRPTITFHNVPVSMRVCSLHFHSGKPAYETNESHPDWAPSLHLGHTKVTAADKERFQQRKRRWDTILASGGAAASPAPADVNEESATAAAAPRGSDQHGAAHEGTQGPPQNCTLDIDQCVSCKNVCGQMRSMHAELDRLLEENETLKKELSAVRLDEEFFGEADEKARDDKVKYYTGLPRWSLLHALHAAITPCLTKGGRKVTPFQMLLLTLMRLRLDLSEQHLGYLFRISSETASKMFRKTLDALHLHLSPLVRWPARECLLHTTPRQFREAFGGRVAVILDCFEVATEKPPHLKAQSEIYAQFNQKDAVKYLLGITPQGAVCFVSEGCGQRVSDKRLTEQCGILHKLLPGDFLLADRGFNVADEDGLMCAELKAPGFTRGRARMRPKWPAETQQRAQLRVHVEKVVGLVRDTYSILQHALPMSTLAPLGGEAFSFIDKIVTVCCALTNMSPSVVLQPEDHVIPGSDGETEGIADDVTSVRPNAGKEFM